MSHRKFGFYIKFANHYFKIDKRGKGCAQNSRANSRPCQLNIWLKFLLTFLCFFSYHLQSFASPQAPLNQIPTYLKITQLNGKVFDSELEKNKLILVMFWASWCNNCKRDMPALDELYKKYQQRGFSIIAISTDGARQRAKNEELAAKFSFPSAIASDVIKSSFALPNRVPTYYLINKEGKFLGGIFMNENFEKRAFEAIIKRHLEI